VIFHTLKTVQYYMAKAETTTGLKVKVGQGQRALWAILVRCNACAFGRSFV
jgi:hypothetical protein